MVVKVRTILNSEGKRLRNLMRKSKEIITVRRANVILLSAQGFIACDISDLTGYSVDHAREIIKAFNKDGFDSLNPKYCGGRPPKFSEEDRAKLVSLATTPPRDLGLPFQQWSLSRLQREVINQGIVDSISKEWLRIILHEATITNQSFKTWKESKDPEFEKKKKRIEQLLRKKHNPPIVLSADEMGPLSLLPKKGRHWAKEKEPGRVPATYHKNKGVRHFLGVFNTKKKRIWGYLSRRKRAKEWFSFLKAIRRRYPEEQRIYIIQDNFAAHWTEQIRIWARANKVTLVPTPTNASWLNPIECEFTSLQEMVFSGSNYQSWDEVGEIIKGAMKYRNKYREKNTKRKKHKIRKPLWLRH